MKYSRICPVQATAGGPAECSQLGGRLSGTPRPRGRGGQRGGCGRAGEGWSRGPALGTRASPFQAPLRLPAGNHSPGQVPDPPWDVRGCAGRSRRGGGAARLVPRPRGLLPRPRALSVPPPPFLGRRVGPLCFTPAVEPPPPASSSAGEGVLMLQCRGDDSGRSDGSASCLASHAWSGIASPGPAGGPFADFFRGVGTV